MQSDDLLEGTMFEGMGINPVSHDRWIQGVGHDTRSEELYAILESSDYVYGGDYFEWSKGGDGDNGETLMYGIDRHFWALDHGTLEEDRAAVGGPVDASGRPVEVGDILLFGENKYAPSDKSLTIQRLEKVHDMYWYAFGADDRKVKVKDATRPHRVGLQWRGLLPEGPFEVGDYVTSGWFEGVERVMEIRSGPDDLYNAKTPSFLGPPELFEFATPEEMEAHDLHESLPTRFF